MSTPTRRDFLHATALASGKVIEFDPKTERITNDTGADKILTREYRDHWGTPVE
jgi:hypothetical protein